MSNTWICVNYVIDSDSEWMLDKNITIPNHHESTLLTIIKHSSAVPTPSWSKTCLFLAKIRPIGTGSGTSQVYQSSAPLRSNRPDPILIKKSWALTTNYWLALLYMLFCPPVFGMVASLTNVYGMAKLATRLEFVDGHKHHWGLLNIDAGWWWWMITHKWLVVLNGLYC